MGKRAGQCQSRPTDKDEGPWALIPKAPRQEIRRLAYFLMSFVSGCIAALDWVEAVEEPLSEHADRVTTAKQTRQTSM